MCRKQPFERGGRRSRRAPHHSTPCCRFWPSTTSAGLHSCSPNKIEGWVKAPPDWLENRQRRPSFPADRILWRRCCPPAAQRGGPERRRLACPSRYGPREAPGRGRGRRGRGQSMSSSSAGPKGAGAIDVIQLRCPGPAGLARVR